ncbi:MAG: VOC family protein [Pseudomonadota bacterium]
MITALDHFVILCPDIDTGISDYTAIMGFEPAWRAETEGRSTALFVTDNTAIELMAPVGTGDMADRLRTLMDQGAHFASLAYRVDEFEESHRLMGRRGLAPDDIVPGQSKDLASGSERVWRRFRLNEDATAGVKSFVLEPTSVLPPGSGPVGSVLKLDHLVVQTPNPDRAVALYGSRLGIRFALDRTAKEWDTRFLFFRIGDLSLEVVNRLSESQDPAGPDRLWGLTWTTDDIEAAHARLTALGRDLSEIRKGRKPGTRVFTLRDRTLNVPTLFIELTPR